MRMDAELIPGVKITNQSRLQQKLDLLFEFNLLFE